MGSMVCSGNLCLYHCRVWPSSVAGDIALRGAAVLRAIRRAAVCTQGSRWRWVRTPVSPFLRRNAWSATRCSRNYRQGLRAIIASLKARSRRRTPRPTSGRHPDMMI